MRLIDADALMEDLSKWLKEVDPTHPPEDIAMPPMEDIIVSTLMTIEEQPTVEAVPERKKGRWINEGIYGEGHSQCSIRCSNCDWHYIGYPGDYKYCPECGSKNMEGAKNE